MRRSCRAAGAAACALMLGPSAHAQDWEFSVAPYLWGSALSGDTTPLPTLPPAHIDMSFSDVVDELQMAFAVAGEAHRGRWSLIGDFSYSDIGSSDSLTVRDRAFVALGSGAKNITATGAVGYRVVETPGGSLDVLGGGRLSWADSELVLTGPLGNQIRGSNDETWVDPIVGVRGVLNLAEKWSLSGYGDVGGFGVASDLTYQLYGAVNYRINDSFSASAGYRYYSVDYEKGGFVNDLTYQGPIAGVRFHF